MQSKTTRGLRRLLVSTGVISLVLSVAAPAALAEKPDSVEQKQQHDRATGEDTSDPLVVDDAHPSAVGKVWVCHENNGTKEVNLIDVSDNSVDHGDGRGGHEYGERIGNLAEALSLLDPAPEDALLATILDFTNPSKADLRILTPHLCETPPANDVVGGGTEGDQPGNDGVGDGLGGGQSGNNGGGEGAGGESGNSGGGEATGGQSGTDEQAEESTAPPADEPTKGEPIISTVTVTRPTPAAPATPATPTAPAAPATPATPAVPAAPQAPATPAAQAVTNVPAAPTAPAPSVVVSSTSRGNEVLGSVTTRTPGGASVTALAATGTSTTVALAALGAVLLLAGLGLQVTARRVQSCAVGA